MATSIEELYPADTASERRNGWSVKARPLEGVAEASQLLDRRACLPKRRGVIRRDLANHLGAGVYGNGAVAFQSEDDIGFTARRGFTGHDAVRLRGRAAITGEDVIVAMLVGHRD